MVFAVCIGLAFISVPIAIVIGSTALLCIALLTDVPLFVVTQQMFRAVDTTILIAIPLFILGSNLMTSGKTAKRLVAAIEAWVGHVTGGLAFTVVFACVFFAAITGSSLATLAAIGTIMFPAMREAGYGEKFTLGVITCAGSLGVMLPPSIPMILYGGMMDVSITKQFVAGAGPAALLGAVLIGHSYIQAKRHGWKARETFSLSQALDTLRKGIWALLLPILVIGGIYSGVFTPAEASAVCVVYVILIELFVYRDMRINQMFTVIKDSAIFSGSLLFILCNSTALSWFLASEEIPERIASFIFGYVYVKWVFLLLLNIFLLIVGCFLDIITAMVILLPLLHDLVNKFGISFLHFGIIFIFNLEMGFLTPPMGLNLFISSGVAQKPILDVFKAVIPFLIFMALCLIVVTYIPSLSLWFPGFLYD